MKIRFREVLDQIEADPQAFNMYSWSSYVNEGDQFYNPENWEWEPVTECGTTYCIAGWAIHLAAVKLGVSSESPGLHDEILHVQRALKMPSTHGLYSETAARLFGLDERETGVLFYGDPEETLPLLRLLADEQDREEEEKA